MTSVPRGTSTSDVEVTNVSKFGVWLLLQDEEVFLPFVEFLWFEQATISQITRVEMPSPTRLYWPDLDVDLAVESLFHPERFPLLSGVHTLTRENLPLPS